MLPLPSTTAEEAAVGVPATLALTQRGAGREWGPDTGLEAAAFADCAAMGQGAEGGGCARRLGRRETSTKRAIRLSIVKTHNRF